MQELDPGGKQENCYHQIERFVLSCNKSNLSSHDISSKPVVVKNIVIGAEGHGFEPGQFKSDTVSHCYDVAFFGVVLSRR